MPARMISGGDVHDIIGPLTKLDMPGLLASRRMTGDVVKAMRACPQPIVAAIDGICAGAGAMLALASDIRIAGVGEPRPDSGPGAAQLGAALDEPGSSERADRGPRSVDRPSVAGPGLFGTVPDQGGLPDIGPGRGRLGATRPPRGPVDRRVGADDLPRPRRGRTARAIGPQVSLFDDLADDVSDDLADDLAADIGSEMGADSAAEPHADERSDAADTAAAPRSAGGYSRRLV